MTKKQRKTKVRKERRKTNSDLKDYTDEPMLITWAYQKKDGGEWEKIEAKFRKKL